MNKDNEGNGKHLAEVERKLQSKKFLAAFELDFPPVNHEQMEAAVESILVAVGEDPQREGLVDTPRRVARAYEEMLSGYRTDPTALLNNALFDVDYDDMVIVKDIEFASFCEHHLLPFVGHAHVAYIPNGKVIGLSKIPRIVDMFAQRLQVQERMTRQIAEFINEILNPVGVGVVVEGVHMCSMIRGVEKHDASMTTSAMLGTFREKSKTRNEFLAHLNRAGSKHPSGF
jgi:GTP cyclohydrolase I